MDKQLSIIYFSATDTTAKVVKEVANSLTDQFKEYNITFPDQRQESLCFGGNDLVIVGVPVYSGRVPKFLLDYFTKVKGDKTLAVFIVVYGNRDYDDALLELKDTLEEKGFIGVAAGAFIGEHSYTVKVATGRPDAGDLQIAQTFAAKIKEKLKALGDKVPEEKLTVKGKYPYKERPASPLMAPVTSAECLNCGICAEYCPMRAISFDDFQDADPGKCIRCCSCVKRCPVQAKTMQHEAVAKITQMLLNNYTSRRCEPEFFLG
ncbi:EFR1 family ferrodoxin [Desulfosporosinus sp. PR]|uniref:EFR1 family ferrodoxin n=1 Tax=Candidatus Desulfosporosinus nitrosoreducens TaxID=3401928 RepID=UPI0027EBF7F2|nr:EFR1 family ferrodoxin [Desulfosporosinus sp. PR]MDQ7094689.1 EFR1 family ferrodoxin [Desulfosporosinus sp. PR]